jgi:alpha-beta hydrolase superfamily lysophospholipase
VNKPVVRRLLIGDFNGKRVIRSVLFIVIAVYLGLFLYAYFFADRIAFQPPPSSYRDSNRIHKIAVEGNVRLSGIYLDNPTADYTILFAHGNAEDLGMVQPFLEEMRKAGFSVFAYDYRGYGTSNGMPGESKGYEDVVKVYQYLTEELKIPSERIIAHGRSLGGAFAIQLASQKPLGGLVIESSFTSGFRVLTQVPLFPLDRFCNLSKLKTIRCPTLFIHGRRDEIIRFSHGEKLYLSANEPKAQS